MVGGGRDAVGKLCTADRLIDDFEEPEVTVDLRSCLEEQVAGLWTLPVRAQSLVEPGPADVPVTEALIVIELKRRAAPEEHNGESRSKERAPSAREPAGASVKKNPRKLGYGLFHAVYHVEYGDRRGPIEAESRVSSGAPG